MQRRSSSLYLSRLISWLLWRQEGGADLFSVLTFPLFRLNCLCHRKWQHSFVHHNVTGKANVVCSVKASLFSAYLCKCICVFVYLCICVFVYLYLYLCICAVQCKGHLTVWSFVPQFGLSLDKVSLSHRSHNWPPSCLGVKCQHNAKHWVRFMEYQTQMQAKVFEVHKKSTLWAHFNPKTKTIPEDPYVIFCPREIWKCDTFRKYYPLHFVAHVPAAFCVQADAVTKLFSVRRHWFGIPECRPTDFFCEGEMPNPFSGGNHVKKLLQLTLRLFYFCV